MQQCQLWAKDDMKCSRILRHVPVLILLSCLASPFLPAQSSTNSLPQPTSSVLASRMARLRHGINASEWFAQVYDTRGYTKEHFQNWTTAEDMALMKSMGFDHVRLSVNPQPMMANHPPNEIPADYLGYLDAAVRMILDQQMAVVIDLHPESDFKARLAKDDSAVQELADFWRALAKHYSTWDSERV